MSEERQTVRYAVAPPRDPTAGPRIRKPPVLKPEDYANDPVSIRRRLQTLMAEWRKTAETKHRITSEHGLGEVSRTAHVLDQRIKDLEALMRMAGLT